MVSDFKEFVKRNVELDGVYFDDPANGGPPIEKQLEAQAQRVVANIRFRRKVADRVAAIIGPEYE